MSQIEFIVRARAAPVLAEQFLGAIGQGEGVENLADIFRSSLFIAQSHRANVKMTLVLERSRDFSRVLTIDGDQLGSIASLHEASLLGVLADALRVAETLGKDQQVNDARGIVIRAMSFEQLIKERLAAETGPVLYMLDKKGADVRETAFTGDVCFVMTDHTPMPKKSLKALVKQGLRPLSVGPAMLHASQCITILLNEMDRQRF